MNESIKNRLEALKAQFKEEITYCIVKLPDGTEHETTMDEWYRHHKEWKWQRMSKGGDNRALFLLFAALDDEVAEDAMQKGDMETAMRFTASAARRLAEYERGSG